ncbi:hypothetical protein SCHPADRAFT_55780 [Schizopora paradoxa]|uniref:Uncharacterized protein n=1 Tax=Schizopora paradoxa TaxID=27342 RepID=A0A0H2S651_9AGAM|nr:hypothetical protein SCHPADRAFT_55780 [Schizopora paradoxa]
MMADISTLPLDILYLIFLNTLPSQILVFRTSVSFLNVSPVNLLSVCRAWRSVVLSRPSLWTFIQVKQIPSDSRLHDDPLDPPALRALESWVKHSGTSPMNIRLQLSQIRNEQVYRTLLRLFLPESHRCTDIDISVECCGAHATRSMREHPSPVAIQCAPSTKSVRLVFQDLQQAEPPVTWAPFSLASCTVDAVSQLQVLDLYYNVKCLFPERRDDLHLPNLRDLSICIDVSDRVAVSDLSTLLSACPVLSVLSIGSRGKSFNSFDTGPRSVPLPFLASFTFTSTDQAFANHLLSVLACPALRKCNLVAQMSMGPVTPEYLHVVAQFLSCDGTVAYPPLVDLCLRFWEPEDSLTEYLLNKCSLKLMKLLDRVRHLERLRLFDVVVRPELIRAMTFVPGTECSGVMCPRLECLHIKSRAGYASLKNLLHEMKSSRSNLSSPLSELRDE